MKKNIFNFLLFFCLVGITNIRAQSFSYYPFNSQFAISSNPTNEAFFEGRLQMNSATSLITTELGLMVNVKKNETAVMYLGGGLNIGWASSVLGSDEVLKGFYGSVGTRVFPFEKYRKVGINFEITPYTNTSFSVGLLRAWLGLSYNFGENKLKKD